MFLTCTTHAFSQEYMQIQMALGSRPLPKDVGAWKEETNVIIKEAIQLVSQPCCHKVKALTETGLCRAPSQPSSLRSGRRCHSLPPDS